MNSKTLTETIQTVKYQYVDSLRGIAILLVVIHHTVAINVINQVNTHLPELTRFILSNGRWGVQLFFIVSAYTLMLSQNKRQYEEHATRNFFIRRLFRIAPMYYIAIVFFTFAIFLGFDYTNFAWSEFPKKALISSIFFVNGLIPSCINNYVPGGWSITVEFTFYAMFPFIFRRIKSLNDAIVFTMLTTIICNVADVLLRGTSIDTNNFLNMYILSQLPVFSLGILVYWIRNDVVKNVKMSTWLWLSILITTVIYCNVKDGGYLIQSISFFTLLLVLSYKEFKLFSNSFLAKIGQVSFSMYIVHFMIITMLNRYKLPFSFSINDTFSAYIYFILAASFLISASFLVSKLCYKYVEVPGQNMGRKIIKYLNS